MSHHPTHSGQPDKHPKQDFQVERLAFFSDAVVAIAITLLVLEIKVPHIAKDSTYEQVLAQLADLKYGIGAMLVSFMVISSYWQLHHLLFKHIQNYNRTLVWANMVFLLTIIVFPLTTSLFAESGENVSVFNFGFKLFFANNILVLLALYAVYLVAFKLNKELTFELTPAEEREVKVGLFFPLMAYTGVLIASFISNDMNVILAVILISIIGKRIFTRVTKAKPSK